MVIQCMRMEIIFTNFEWQLQEIWGSKFVTKSSKSTSIIALGMAFSRIKFTIFFVLFPVSFRTAVLSYDLFVFLFTISCHSNVCEKFDFCFTDFRQTIACLCVTRTAQISTDVVAYVKIYLGKRHWRKKST